MRKIGLIFLTLCCMILYTGCTIATKADVASENKIQNMPEISTPEATDANFHTYNCMLDDTGNLLIMREDRYEPYVYDKFPNMPGSVSEITQLLCVGDNYLKLEYRDKLSLYYELEKDKCQIVGGNNVDIFNFSIDREQDLIEFSVEGLSFPGCLDDNYGPQLLETFKLLFGESGEELYEYFMAFYEEPTDGMTDETRIDGMRVIYRCTPKHRLSIYLESGE